MQGIAAERLLGQEIGPSYFGANILATRDRLGPDGTYDDMANQLGINAVRYPGGSLTERYLTSPTQTKPARCIISPANRSRCCLFRNSCNSPPTPGARR